MGDDLSTEVAWDWIHQVEAIKEILLKCVKSTISPVARWFKNFLMESVDDLLVVNFDDSAAARGFGFEGQHGEQAAGLAFVVGRYEISDIPRHRIICVNE